MVQTCSTQTRVGFEPILETRGRCEQCGTDRVHAERHGLRVCCRCGYVSRVDGPPINQREGLMTACLVGLIPDAAKAAPRYHGHA
jgi:ribosomal protein S27AE